MLNELEFAGNNLLANIYLTNKIAVIDPSSGKVSKYFPLKCFFKNTGSLNLMNCMKEQKLITMGKLKEEIVLMELLIIKRQGI